MSDLIEHIVMDNLGNVESVVRCVPEMDYNAPTKNYIATDNKGLNPRFKYDKVTGVFKDKEGKVPDKSISETKVPKKYKDKKKLPGAAIVSG